MAFGGIETGLRERGIDNTSPIIRGIRKEYGETQLAERSPDIEKFDPQTTESLQGHGLYVCTLTGRTPEDISNAAEMGISIRFKNFESLFVPSKRTQIAFDPNTPFLPGSNKLTFRQQMKRLADLNRMVQEEMPQIKAIAGSVSDWMEAAAVYYSATRQIIFSKRHGFKYTTTSTRDKNRNILEIGGAGKVGCIPVLDIKTHYPKEMFRSVFLMPMFVPAGLKI